jgi:hypothetical protein
MQYFLNEGFGFWVLSYFTCSMVTLQMKCSHPDGGIGHKPLVSGTRSKVVMIIPKHHHLNH